MPRWKRFDVSATTLVAPSTRRNDRHDASGQRHLAARVRRTKRAVRARPDGSVRREGDRSIPAARVRPTTGRHVGRTFCRKCRRRRNNNNEVPSAKLCLHRHLSAGRRRVCNVYVEQMYLWNLLLMLITLNRLLTRPLRRLTTLSLSLLSYYFEHTALAALRRARSADRRYGN